MSGMTADKERAFSRTNYQETGARGTRIPSRGFRNSGDREIINCQPVFRASARQTHIHPSNPERCADRDIQKTNRARNLALIGRQITIVSASADEVWSNEIKARRVNPGTVAQ